MGIFDYLSTKRHINHIKKTVADYSVFDGLTENDVCDLYDKYTRIISDISANFASDDPEVKRSLENRVLNLIKNNPAVLTKISTRTDSNKGYYFNSVFEALCRNNMDKSINYILNDSERAGFVDVYGNSAPMIAILCDRGDIALKGLKTGNCDLLCQNDLGENIGMMTIGLGLKEQDEILKICAHDKKLCLQKDIDGDNLLTRMAYWITSKPTKGFVESFKYMLSDSKIRANKNNDEKDVWEILHSLKCFDFGVLDGYAELENHPNYDVNEQDLMIGG